jgi:hypothetical protein
MNEKTDAVRSWGLCPQTLGIYRIVAKGKWHLILQWYANFFPLAYRLWPIACRDFFAFGEKMDAEEWEWGIRKCNGKFLVSTSPGLSHFRGLGVFRGSSRGIASSLSSSS